MALIEAMAATLPVVATSVSGTRDVVLDGKTGLLVAPGDSRALAEAIDRLLADPQQAAQMGRAGRRRVEQQYGAGRQAEEHLILFEQSTGTEDRTVLGWR